MIVLDTNVISEPMTPRADPRVVAWLNRQDPKQLYTTAVNLAELLKGLATMPDGQRKRGLEEALFAFRQKFSHAILPFDEAAADALTVLTLQAKSKNYTLPVADSFVAAIATAHGYTVATRDVEPFIAAGVPVVNPWES